MEQTTEQKLRTVLTSGIYYQPSAEESEKNVLFSSYAELWAGELPFVRMGKLLTVTRQLETTGAPSHVINPLQKKCSLGAG